MSSFTPANAVWSTWATAPSSGGATTGVVATGDGAKFSAYSPSTTSPIRCVVVDTSTSPETVKEYVDVTGVSGDTLTIVRAVEEATRFPAAAMTAGWYIAAVQTVRTLAKEVPDFWLKRDFGAKGDGIYVRDAAITSGTNTLACATATPFKSTDVGKAIAVLGAGAAAAPLVTTISGFTDSGHVTLTANAGTTVSAAMGCFGTDDTTAINNARAACEALNEAICWTEDGVYVIAGSQTVGNTVSAQILFPANPVSGKERVVGFEGRRPPPIGQANVKLGTVSPKMHESGAIFQSFLLNGVVFGCDTNASGWSASYTFPHFDGVTIRTLGGTGVTVIGLNTSAAAGFNLGNAKGLLIDVLTDYPFVPQPAASFGSIGLVGPTAGSFGLVRAGMIDIRGYYLGFIPPGDHGIFEHIIIAFAVIPVYTQTGYFGCSITRLTTYSTNYGLVAGSASPSPLLIDTWCIEDDGTDVTQGPLWVAMVAHLNCDTGNVLLGSVDNLVRSVEQVGNTQSPLVRGGTSPASIKFKVKYQYGAGTIIEAANKYNATVDPTVTDDVSKGWFGGDGWLNTTRKVLWQLVDNTAGAAVWTRQNYSSTSRTSATSAIANTETSVLSLPINANRCISGTTFRVRAGGLMTGTTTSTSAVFRIRIGTTTLTGNVPASITAATGTTARTNMPFSLEGEITVYTTGASGTVLGYLTLNLANAVQPVISAPVTAAVALDTTAAKIVELTCISGGSTSTFTFTSAEIVEAA